MRFMAYQHHKRTDSQTEIVTRNQLLCIYTSNVNFQNQLRPSLSFTTRLFDQTDKYIGTFFTPS